MAPSSSWQSLVGVSPYTQAAKIAAMPGDTSDALTSQPNNTWGRLTSAIVSGMLDNYGQQKDQEAQSAAAMRLRDALVSGKLDALGADPVWAGYAPELFLDDYKRGRDIGDKESAAQIGLKYGLAEKGKILDSGSGQALAIPNFYEIDANAEGMKSSAGAAGRLQQQLKYEPQIEGAKLQKQLDYEPAIEFNKKIAQATAEGSPIFTAATNKKNAPAGEDSLRKEYQGTPEYKNFSTVDTYYKQMVKSFSSDKPGSDLSFIYGVMKIVDPNSVVREGEAATAANAGGIPEYLRAQYNKALDGGQILTDNQRLGLAEVGKKFYEQQADKIGSLRSGYEGTAKERGLNPNNIFYEKAPGDAGKMLTSEWSETLRKRAGDKTVTVGGKQYNLNQLDDESINALYQAGKLNWLTK
jgi:hypothetical protein